MAQTWSVAITFGSTGPMGAMDLQRIGPEHGIVLIGNIRLMVWAGLRFADAQRTCPSSLLPDRHIRPTGRVLSNAKFPDLASPLLFLRVGDMCTSTRFAQNLVIYVQPCPDCNQHALQHGHGVSPASPTSTADAKRSNEGPSKPSWRTCIDPSLQPRRRVEGAGMFDRSRHVACSAHSLPDQCLSGCDPDRAVNREF